MENIKKAALQFKEKLSKQSLKSMLKEAVSNNDTVASKSLLYKIADRTSDPADVEEILEFVWKALKSPTKEWKKVSKTLALLDTIIKVGDPRALHQLRDSILKIRVLESFSCKENGVEKADCVKQKATRICYMLSNKGILEMERNNAINQRERFVGISSRDPGSYFSSEPAYSSHESGYLAPSAYEPPATDQKPNKVDLFANTTVKRNTNTSKSAGLPKTQQPDIFSAPKPPEPASADLPDIFVNTAPQVDIFPAQKQTTEVFLQDVFKPTKNYESEQNTIDQIDLLQTDQKPLSAGGLFDNINLKKPKQTQNIFENLTLSQKPNVSATNKTDTPKASLPADLFSQPKPTQSSEPIKVKSNMATEKAPETKVDPARFEQKLFDMDELASALSTNSRTMPFNKYYY